MIKQRIVIVKFVDKILKDMLTIATFYISFIRNLSKKKHSIRLVLLLLFVFSGLNLNGQQAILQKQILGSGGMIELYDNSGIIMSGLVTQTAIEQIVITAGIDSFYIYQGFWIPEDSLISEVETTIKLSNNLNNYPNPLTNSTKINYELSGTGNVSIRIYDNLGNLVKALFNGIQGAGQQVIDWDAKNESGIVVSSGVYLLELDFNPVQISNNQFIPYKLRTMMVVVK